MGVKILEAISRLRVLSVSLTTLALIAPLDNPHKIVYDKPIKQEYDFIVGENMDAFIFLQTRR